MEKFIPYEKLSKKQKRELDKKRRNTWGSLNPVTRNTANPKAYNRKKARNWSDENLSVPFLIQKVLYTFSMNSLTKCSPAPMGA